MTSTTRQLFPSTPSFGVAGPAFQRAAAELRPARPNPLLYQVDTRVLLASLSHELGRQATMDDISDAVIDRIAADGFDWVWLLGVWQTGAAARQVSLGNPEWRREYRQLLPDFSDVDISGSCFAIRSYSVHTDFGGNPALRRLRRRMRDCGLRLMLDFVPNHLAPDHAWARYHPEYFVPGTEAQIESEPQNYMRVDTLHEGSLIMAHGRDAFSTGWQDTLQLNYANPDVREAMASELVNIAALCDGVCCDRAALILPEVFERTWGVPPEPFWREAISRTRARYPAFLFVAEAGVDMGSALEQQGFEYSADQQLYDRLREGRAGPVLDQLRAETDSQRRSVRFLERHEGPRAAAEFLPEPHQAAAIVTFLCAGIRFIHQGQLEGLSKRIPVHLNRVPAEVGNEELSNFYERLVRCLRHPCAQGDWRMLECREDSDGNATWESYISFAWSAADQPSLIVAVNYAPHPNQCYLPIPADLIEGDTIRFRDLMGALTYFRDSDVIRQQGLCLDLPAWGYHVFEVISK
jgi:glycosidase